MPGSSYSTQSSSGQSTSSPVQTPQSEWGLQLSQLLGALGQNQYNWAMQQFNNGMGVTDRNIQQYMDLAGKGAGLAQNLLSRYENVFEPLMDQFIKQAGSYASEGRQRFMAGQAESTVAQADQQARDSAERNLQSFGINPNSGRYQDLMLTSRIQDAAARAGAGTQASLNTADRGRQMLQTAAQMGQNVPGMTVNALQSAYTGITGAENAILGMLNTGANLTQSAAPYFNAASGAIKNPSQGQQSTNASRGQSGSVQGTQSGGNSKDQNRQPAGQGRGDGQGGNPRPGQGSSPSNQTGQPKAITNPFYNQPGAGVLKNPNATQDNNDDGTGATPYPTVGSPELGPYFDQNGNFTPIGLPGLGETTWDQASQNPTSNWQLPQNTPDFGNQGGAQQSFNYDPQQGDGVGQGPGGPQPSYDPGNVWQPTQGNAWDNQPQGGGYQVTDNTGGGQQGGSSDYWNNFSNDFGQQTDFGNYAQQYGGGSDYSQQPSGFDESGFANYAGYAAGGRVRPRGVLPTTGGHVSPNASPSRGQQTDDVPARLNAGEFVIPRDVVAHQGTKFFSDLITKSRKLRTGMGGPPARGQRKPALPNMGRPTFVSRAGA